MASSWPPDAVGLRYLLGTLEEPELSRLEEALIADEEVQAWIGALEADLVDRYVTGRLAPGDRKQFESRYLRDTAGRGAVDFSRLLGRSLAGVHETGPLRAAASRRSWRGVAAALAVASLSLVGLSWWRTRQELRTAQAEAAAARAALAFATRREPPVEAREGEGSKTLAEPPADGPRPRPTASPQRDRQPGPAEIAFALTPGALRGLTAGQTLSIPVGTDSIRLELRSAIAVDGEYRAVVLSPEGLEVWRGEDLPLRVRGTSAVGLTVPASRLRRGDYMVRLFTRAPGGTWESLAAYSFRVAVPALSPSPLP